MGKVSTACQIKFTIPTYNKGIATKLKVTLTCEGQEWENFWNFWVFPVSEYSLDNSVKVVDKLDKDLIDFIYNGGKVLLLDNFPCIACEENFRSFTSGRSLGHGGAIINNHPIWEKFPHAGFLDWQFFPLMNKSKSIIYNEDMPEFTPIFELIPSFKMVRHKSMLSEFVVGKGRLMLSAWRFDVDDPGAKYMLKVLVEYLKGNNFADAPIWEKNSLTSGLALAGYMEKMGKKVDSGGRPVEG
jgi:hypothetical protein